MHILVLNPGSSSIKFSMHEVGEGAGAAGAGAAESRTLYEGELGGIGGRREKLEFRDAAGNDLSGRLGEVKPGSMQEAIAVVERAVGLDGLPPPDAVGYRVVHPGAHLRGHQRLTAEVLAELRAACEFAPLHDPEALEMIGEMMRRFADVPHIACFDTVFHETMPEEATVYALPYAVRRQGVRRYGFHGLSCESVVAQMREAAGAGVSAVHADRAPGQRVQRDGVHRGQVGGHDDGADADRRRDDGDADRRPRSRRGSVPDAAGGRDGGFGGADDRWRRGAEGAGRGERYARAAQAGGRGERAGGAGDSRLLPHAW